MKLLGFAVVGVLAGCVAGCGQDPQEAAMEKAIERQTGQETQVEMDKEGMRIESEGGALSIASGGAATVPEDFPQDVYIYENGDLQMAVRSPEGFTLSLSTSDEPGEVAETYMAALDREGWSRQTQMDMGGQHVLVYEKGERIANVSVASEGGKTQVTVTVVAQ